MISFSMDLSKVTPTDQHVMNKLYDIIIKRLCKGRLEFLPMASSGPFIIKLYHTTTFYLK